MRKERAQNLAEAKKVFEFLEREYGMQRTYAGNVDDAWQVRYASDLIYVVVGEMPPGFEFDMRFGRIGADEEPAGYPFTIADILSLPGCGKWDWRAETSTISGYAHILENCGKEILSCNPEVIADLKAKRKIQIHEWQQEQESLKIEKKAQHFWKDKNYSQYIKTIETLRTELTELHHKRLLFAKKMIAKYQS
jgi:hypothetical protein